MWRSTAAFSLIEIMVVLVIIGIIAGFVAPNVLPYSDDAKLVAAKSDLAAISNALDLYKLDHSRYPTTQQGLEALVSSGTRDGGYLKKMPVDPWDNPYQYLSPGTHGTYDLYSLGADGTKGGSGIDADIGNWE